MGHFVAERDSRAAAVTVACLQQGRAVRLLVLTGRMLCECVLCARSHFITCTEGRDLGLSFDLGCFSVPQPTHAALGT